MLEFGLILICLLQFTTVTLVVWALFRYPIKPEPPVNRRIALALGLGSRNTLFELPVIGQLLNFGVLAARRWPFFRDRVRQDLEASGNPHGYSVDEYLAICFGSAAAFGIVAVLIGIVLGFGSMTFGVAFVMLGVGFAAAIWSINEMAAARVRKIGRKLPYTLDLIALLLEAGSSFSEAIGTLIRDEPDDQLNEELRLVQAEIEFGTSRASALNNLAQRIPLQSLRSVVGAINQAEALGTPLATILKNQSSMIRMLRSVRAEEAAATASMRILLPSLLILIAVILVVFAPLIISWIREGNPLG